MSTSDVLPSEPGASTPAAPTDGASSRPAPRPAPSPSSTAAGIVALLAFTIPLASAQAIWATKGGSLDWTRRIQIAPFDAVLVVAAGWALLHREHLRAVFRSRAVQVVVGAYVGWFAVAFAAHLNPLAIAYAARLAVGLGVIACCEAAMRTAAGRTILLASVTASGVVQAVIGLLQAARGDSLGSPIDFGFGLYRFGTSVAVQGGLPHPYHLTSFLLVTQGAALLGLRHRPARRVLWLAAIAMMGLGVALTYSRAGAIAEALVVVSLLVGRADRRVLWSAAVALVLGLAVGGVAFGDGWIARSDTTAGKDQGVSVDSDRRVRLQEAKELIESSPVVGVGPGRYVEAVARKKRDVYQPAHNLIAHEAAELGIPGGLAVTALLGLLLVRVRRGGAWSAAVALPMLPMMILGSTPYVLGTSLAASAIWLGLVRTSLEPVTDDLDLGDGGERTPDPGAAHAAPAPG